jgi:FkbM family methyltransferase
MTTVDRLKRTVKAWLCGPEVVPALDTLEAHGVETLTVRGSSGLIEFPVSDRSILPVYARTRSWAQRTIDTVVGATARHGMNDGLFLDIGANVGLISLAVCQRTNLAVHAFEPDAASFRLLGRNVALNGLSDRVRCHPVALSDAAGEVVIERSPTNAGDNRIRRATPVALEREQTWETTSAEARRLDDVELDDRLPKVAKIDVQGAEPLVVAGGRRVLASCVLVIFEFSPYHMNRMGVDCSGLFPLIREFNEFTVYKGDRSAEILRTRDRAECVRFLQQHDRGHARRVYGGYLDVVWEKT